MSNEVTTSQQYTWALESAALINAIVADDTGYLRPDECVDRNVRHLQIMVNKDFWEAGHDMTPLNSAISAGLSYISNS